jgi:hypothetical protein
MCAPVRSQGVHGRRARILHRADGGRLRRSAGQPRRRAAHRRALRRHRRRSRPAWACRSSSTPAATARCGARSTATPTPSASTGARDSRHRVEHIEVLHPDDVDPLCRAGRDRVHAARSHCPATHRTPAMSGRKRAGAGTLAPQLRLADAARGRRPPGITAATGPSRPMDPSLGFGMRNGCASPGKPGDPVQNGSRSRSLIDRLHARRPPTPSSRSIRRGWCARACSPTSCCLTPISSPRRRRCHRAGEAAADDGGWAGGVPGDLATPRRSDAANRIVE